MKESALKTILAVVAALALAYGAVALLGGGEGGDGDTALARALAGVRPDALETVTVEAPAETVRLRRTDGGWRVDGHEADSTAVARLLDALGSPDVGELASRNPANHGKLGVAADSTRRVTLAESGGDSTRVLVGGSAPYSGSGYMRLPGSDRVYVVRGRLQQALSRPTEDWRNKTVARIDTARLARIVVARPEGGYELRRADGAWTVDGEPAEERGVRGLLAQLTRLQAMGFAPDTFRVGRPERSVTALDAAGDTLARILLADPVEGGSTYPVTTAAAGGTVWEISAFRADRVAPAKEEMLPSDEAGG